MIPSLQAIYEEEADLQHARALLTKGTARFDYYYYVQAIENRLRKLDNEKVEVVAKWVDSKYEVAKPKYFGQEYETK